ncbi:MAG: BatD family protein [Kiritimatiellae bacterium]|nr:BatD family protein [Kiritimatiellia bacterium]
MKTARIVTVAIALTMSVAPAWAGQLAARAYTRPERPYAGEDFRLVIEVEADQGETIEIMRVVGLPAAMSLSPLTAEGAREVTVSNATRRITTFVAEGVASRPMNILPRLSATMNVTSLKGNGGFFRMQYTQTTTLPVSCRRMEILPLPPAPAGFTGAIGRFALDLSASPSEVAPGDVVELRLTLSGSGHLGDELPSLPSLDPALFRAYPPSTKRGDGGAVAVVTQSVVPLSTNSFDIGAASFSFFDAEAGAYTNVSTAPLRLVFAERAATGEPAVREIEIGAEGRTAPSDIDVARLLPSRRGQFALGGATTMRVAPGRRAKAIIQLPAGTLVTPLEKAEGFIRVEAKGRTGWIPAPDKTDGGEAADTSAAPRPEKVQHGN